MLAYRRAARIEEIVDIRHTDALLQHQFPSSGRGVREHRPNQTGGLLLEMYSFSMSSVTRIPSALRSMLQRDNFCEMGAGRIGNTEWK